MVVAEESTRLYFERLVPSAPSWLLVPGVGLVVFIMFLPLDQALAMGVGVAVAALVGVWLWTLAAKIEVTTTHLWVGRARIELSSLGELKACSYQEMRHLQGPGSDARSFVLTRPWVRTGVYLEQTDPRDPTPFWLFSSRRPDELLGVLAHLREQG